MNRTWAIESPWTEFTYVGAALVRVFEHASGGFSFTIERKHEVYATQEEAKVAALAEAAKLV